MDPDPVCPERLDPDPDPDSVNITPGPKPWFCEEGKNYNVVIFGKNLKKKQNIIISLLIRRFCLNRYGIILISKKSMFQQFAF